MSSDLAHVITLYLPTFSEISMWDFHPGSAGIWQMTQSFPKIPEEVRSLPKTSEVCRRRSYWQNAYPQNQRLRGRYNLSFINFTHGFRSLHGSELTYFWKLCQARRQQLKFSNQAWEIGPQAWVGVRSKYSTRRRESWQVYHVTGNENV